MRSILSSVHVWVNVPTLSSPYFCMSPSVTTPQATRASQFPCVYALSVVVVRLVVRHLFTRQETLQPLAPSGRTDPALPRDHTPPNTPVPLLLPSPTLPCGVGAGACQVGKHLASQTRESLTWRAAPTALGKTTQTAQVGRSHSPKERPRAWCGYGNCICFPACTNTWSRAPASATTRRRTYHRGRKCPWNDVPSPLSCKRCVRCNRESLHVRHWREIHKRLRLDFKRGPRAYQTLGASCWGRTCFSARWKMNLRLVLHTHAHLGSRFGNGAYHRTHRTPEPLNLHLSTYNTVISTNTFTASHQEQLSPHKLDSQGDEPPKRKPQEEPGPQHTSWRRRRRTQETPTKL